MSTTVRTDAPGCTPAPEAHAMGDDAASRLAPVLKALADPLRLRMLSYVATSASGEACVCDIATVADVSQPTVSHHLKVLKDVGVLTAQRRGTWVYYRVEPRLRGAVTTLLDAFAPAALDGGHAPVEIGLVDTDAVLDRVIGRLTVAFPAVDRGAVQDLVRESFTALARTAGVAAHLVALTERFARQRLADRTRPAGETRPHVLFVCVANAGRSQLAAALLRHHGGDRVVVRSAGSAPAATVHAPVLPALHALGADDDAYPKPLTDDAVRAADVVVTLGCGDTCPVLPGTRYEDWVVGDPALASPDGVAAIRDDLDRRVRALLADLLPTDTEEPR